MDGSRAVRESAWPVRPASRHPTGPRLASPARRDGRLRAGRRRNSEAGGPTFLISCGSGSRGIWCFSFGFNSSSVALITRGSDGPVACVGCAVPRAARRRGGRGGAVSVDFRSFRLEKALKSLPSGAAPRAVWVCCGEGNVECALLPQGFRAKLKIVESKNDICEIH